MKLVNQETSGRQVIETFCVDGVLAGRGCQEVRLDYRDFASLQQLPPERLHDWVQFMCTKFSKGTEPLDARGLPIQRAL